MTAKPRASASVHKSKPTRRRVASKRPASSPAKRTTKRSRKDVAPTPPEAPPVATVVESTVVESAVVESTPADATPLAKGRRRGLGALSKHAFSPVSAALNLVTRPRALPAMESVRASVPPTLPGDAVGYLRTELASLLALLEES